MPNDLQHDVAIVGASIAGCTAAILFARNGARVALIEREREPAAYKKICTHYIQPSATQTIERLGLAKEIEEAGGIRNDIEVFTRWGWIVHSPRRNMTQPTYGYNIRREKLDPMIRKRAMTTPGVDFIPGFTARQLLVSKSRISGALVHGADGSQKEIQAKLVVGADGRQTRIQNSPVSPRK